jgi:DNA-binding transcriptional MerR regulator
MSIKFSSEKLLSEEEIEFLTSSIFAEEFPFLNHSKDEPKYSINDLKVSPRDATYWDKQGILPVKKGVGMRRKYDLHQSIWIKFIQQMRLLGIGLKTIKSLKENLLEPKIDLKELNEEMFLKLFHKLNSKKEMAISPEELVYAIKNQEPSLFQSTVYATIIFRKPFQCLVNKDGDYLIYDLSRYQEFTTKYTEFKEFVSQPYFCLSFSEAYHSLVREWSPEPFIEKTSLLSKTEMEILKMIRNEKIDSFKVRFKDGKPDLIELKEKKNISLENRFLDVIAKNGYQKITLSTRNGKIVNFENKTLKKID